MTDAFLELDNPSWAGTTAAIVCQPHLGASQRKGWYRMIGTLVGAVVIVVLTACFPQDRALFLVALALWAVACALVATCGLPARSLPRQRDLHRYCKRRHRSRGTDFGVQDGRVQSCRNGRPRFPWLPIGRKIGGDRNDGDGLCK
jgi:Fusaric acid resistance protein family